MKIERKKLEDLARVYHFELTEEEKETLERDFIELSKDLDRLAMIDTDGVEPMCYPFEGPTSYLREDDEIEQLTKEEVLENAPKSKNGYFVVSRVVG